MFVPFNETAGAKNTVFDVPTKEHSAMKRWVLFTLLPPEWSYYLCYITYRKYVVFRDPELPTSATEFPISRKKKLPNSWIES